MIQRPHWNWARHLSPQTDYGPAGSTLVDCGEMESLVRQLELGSPVWVEVRQSELGSPV